MKLPSSNALDSIPSFTIFFTTCGPEYASNRRMNLYPVIKGITYYYKTRSEYEGVYLNVFSVMKLSYTEKGLRKPFKRNCIRARKVRLFFASHRSSFRLQSMEKNK